MYLDKLFFEKTRLEIMSGPVGIYNTDGRPVYLNKPFKVCTRGCKNRTLEDYSDSDKLIELAKVGAQIHNLTFGRKRLKLASTIVRFFDDTVIMYLDTELCSAQFPVLFRGFIYIAVETLYGRIFVPFLGGEVYGMSDDAHSYNLLPGKEKMVRIGSATDIGIKYFCVRQFLQSFAEKLNSEIKNYGYMIDVAPFIASNSVCLASIYDLTLICELLVCTLAPVSENNIISLGISDVGGMCNINVEVRNSEYTKNRRVGADVFFDGGTDGKRVMSSLVKLCEMYSWKLYCREKINRVVFSVSIPIYNVDPLVFREDTVKSLDPSILEALKLFKYNMDTLKK